MFSFVFVNADSGSGHNFLLQETDAYLGQLIPGVQTTHWLYHQIDQKSNL